MKSSVIQNKVMQLHLPRVFSGRIMLKYILIKPLLYQFLALKCKYAPWLHTSYYESMLANIVKRFGWPLVTKKHYINAVHLPFYYCTYWQCNWKHNDRSNWKCVMAGAEFFAGQWLITYTSQPCCSHVHVPALKAIVLYSIEIYILLYVLKLWNRHSVT